MISILLIVNLLRNPPFTEKGQGRGMQASK